MSRPRADQAPEEPEVTDAAARELGTDAGTDVAEALRALSDQIGGLKEELESLRGEQGTLPAVAPETPGWEHRPVLASSGPAWARNLDAPTARRPAVPRFALEIAFLVAVAVAAAIARLEPLAVIGVLAAAWALVALVEWLAWRAARREDELLARASFGVPDVESDLAWFAPPTEHTAELAERPPAAKLPPARPE